MVYPAGLKGWHILLIFICVMACAVIAGVWSIEHDAPEIAGTCFAVFAILATALALVFQPDPEPVIIVDEARSGGSTS